MQEYIIPNALQIVIDDLGWFNGKNDRENHGPSRTAMPRNHVAEDYLAVNELGRALGTPVVNFNLQKSFDNNILKALITWYMKRGGAQLQITCTSREDLLDAYEHPRKLRQSRCSCRWLFRIFYKALKGASKNGYKPYYTIGNLKN